LALTLQHLGFKVGVLDIDLTGPSIPQMFGLESKIHQSSQGWIPVYTDATKTLGVVSLGFLLQNKDEPVIWRGPKKNAMIQQFVNDVFWGDVDYLLIDTPPGTSDEHISVCGYIKEFNPKAIVVTTPQGVSLSDVRREINFCKKVDIPIIGLVENMSGFVCPHCRECTDLFSSGGGEKLATELSIPFFGRIPIDPQLTQLMETNIFSNVFMESLLFQYFLPMVKKIVPKELLEA
jgi:Mrp family chromosome partitioning ATPase